MNPDDPKFTAHALGELEDLTPEERAEIEALIANDATAAAEARETLALAARLRAELPGEEAAALLGDQRAAVLQATAQHPPVGKVLRFPRRATVLAALAACLVVGVSVALLFPAMQAEKAAVRKSLAVNAPSAAPVENAVSIDLSGPQFGVGLPAESRLQENIPSARLAAMAPEGKPVDSANFGRWENQAGIEYSSQQLARKSAEPLTTSLMKRTPRSIAETPMFTLSERERTAGTTNSFSVTAGGTLVTNTPGTGIRKLPDVGTAPPVRGSQSATRAGSLDLTALAAASVGRTSAADQPAPPESLRADAQEVERLFKSNHYADAARLLTEMDARMPADPYVLTQLGKMFYGEGKYDEAVNNLTKALALDSTNVTAHNYLGIAASQKGWQEAARKELEMAVSLDPNAVDPHFNLAVVLAMQNPPDKARARSLYQHAVRLGAEPDPALEQLIGNVEPSNTEAYDAITDNAFLGVRENPLSTFSIDVDTASYAIVRRFLNGQQRPPKGAVRIEELLNYFTYDYPQPRGEAPFSAMMEVATCPWATTHRLVRIGLKGREIAKENRPAANLVFLLDVSGSMNQPNKLPLLKSSLALLVDQLGAADRVGIVVYAGNSGCVLEPTTDKAKMKAALEKLESGGSTNGASGLELAYQLAEKTFVKGGTNRVILATDGDWNVGVTNQSALLDLIAQRAKSNVFLTVLGFGMGNLKDAMMVKLADRGNGNYAYIDTLNEAKKVLVEQIGGTLITIAKDVKIQVEFNPAQVASYRLIGYEKRVLAKEDFNDDKKDAGEIGAGHTVTALYEVVPVGTEVMQLAKVDDLKYQPVPVLAPAAKPAPATLDLPPEAERLRRSSPERAPADGKAYLLDTEQKQASADKSTASDAATGKDASAGELPSLRAKEAVSPQPSPAPHPASEVAKNLAAAREEPAVARDSLTAGGVRQLLPQAPVAASAGGIGSAVPPAIRGEMLTLKLRYKEPTGDTSKLLEFPLTDTDMGWEKSSPDFRWAAAVAGYGMLLRDSPYKGDATWSAVAEWAQEGLGADGNGYRAEFLALIEKAKALR